MPNRILRDGILTSRAVGSLPEEALLFYYALISVVDDYGRIEADPPILRAKCFPRRIGDWPDKRLTDVCHMTANCLTDDGHPLVTYYQVSGSNKKYLQINNFQQRIRAEKSKCPSPEGQMTVIRPSDDGPPQATRAQRRTESESYSESQSQSVPNGGALPKLNGVAEFPKVLAEIRKHDAAADDHFARRLMTEVIQKCLSNSKFPRDMLDHVNDESVARCVAESYRTGPKDHRAGLLLNRVPGIVLTWSLE